MDRCATRSLNHVVHLSSNTISFFPPNVTSVVQPLDHGMIAFIQSSV